MKQIQTYKSRIEALSDFFTFQKELIFVNAKYDNTPSLKITYQDGEDKYDSATVEFETTLTKDEIYFILSEIEDAHIMLESVKLVEDYDGERNNDSYDEALCEYREFDVSETFVEILKDTKNAIIDYDNI